MRSYLDIGRITAPHGVQGEVRVLPLTERLERFESLAECFLTSPDQRTRRLVKILRTRPNPPFVLVTIEGIDSREAADRLRNHFLSVDREHAIELPEGSWFVCDLIGMAVFDEQHGALGTLKDVLQQTAQDVYVVAAKGQPDLLFPAAGGFIRQVDLEARRMDVSLPDGLVDVYRPDKAEQSQKATERLAAGVERRNRRRRRKSANTGGTPGAGQGNPSAGQSNSASSQDDSENGSGHTGSGQS